jgi:hypothetical protein
VKGYRFYFSGGLYHRFRRLFWEQTPKDWRRRRFLARIDSGEEQKYERLPNPCPKCGGVLIRIKKYGGWGCIDCPHYWDGLDAAKEVSP